MIGSVWNREYRFRAITFSILKCKECRLSLPFTLLADTDTAVSQLYGVWKEKNMYGSTFMGIHRETFLIDKDGIVRKIWHKVRPDDHANEVLEAVEVLGI
ncbi:MAG: peroxiredoxin [Ktedonobacteraceae bacterium]